MQEASSQVAEAVGTIGDSFDTVAAVISDSRQTAQRNNSATEAASAGGHRIALAEVHLQAPVRPSKCLAIGLNYAEHIDEVFSRSDCFTGVERREHDGEAPLEALARAFLERGAATASRYIDEAEKGKALVEKVRACGLVHVQLALDQRPETLRGADVLLELPG